MVVLLTEGKEQNFINGYTAFWYHTLEASAQLYWDLCKPSKGIVSALKGGSVNLG